MRTLRGLAVVLILGGLAPAAPAQEAEPSLLSPTARLEALVTELAEADLTEADAERISREAIDIRARATRCVEEREEQISRLQSNLLILGEATAEPVPAEDGDEEPVQSAATLEEPAEVSQQREAFEKEMAGLRNDIAGCKLVQLRAREINEEALARLGTILAQRLSSHGRPTLDVLRAQLAAPGQALRDAVGLLATPSQLGTLSLGQTLKIALLALLAFCVGHGIRLLVRRWAEHQRGRGGQPAIEVVYARTMARWLAVVFTAGGAALAHRYFLGEAAFDLPLPRLFVALTFMGVAGMFLEWCTGPYSAGSDLIEDPELAAAMRHRGQAIAAACALAYVVFGTHWLRAPPPETGLLLRAAITVFAAASVIWLVRSARLVPAMRGRLILVRVALILAALAVVIAELLGYRNLANHLMRAMLGTVLAGLGLWVLLWVIRAVVEGIVSGKTDLSYKVRSALGMRPNDSSAELVWLRLILSGALWLGFAVLLVSLWDSTGSALPKLTSLVTQGIKLSDQYTLVPQDVLRGLLVFGLVIALTAWVKAQLSKRWLRDTGMDRGSRDALVTLGGYVGFVTAFLLGLVMSGVQLRGFVFILSALGVGIGFGLQNVVGNFVSGLILLFERPIKSGDFVSVGDVEGVVKRIRIRSTEIESLDRRNIIVPNSDLISSQVTNWVLHDPFGRLRLQVGVAYGSDTELIRETLEKIADDHPDVITKGPAPPPRALFMGFGDSALDFELRVWIRQIENRFKVTSDLNFAIDKAFREAGIEIPFPQRDLHVRSWSVDASPLSPEAHEHEHDDASSERDDLDDDDGADPAPGR